MRNIIVNMFNQNIIQIHEISNFCMAFNLEVQLGAL